LGLNKYHAYKRATELRPVRPRIVVLQTSQIGVHAQHMVPAILRYLIYPLAIFNAVLL